MKLKNIILVLKDNLPMKRFLKNLLQGHIKRKFRKRSHERLDGTPKVMYNTQASAKRAAEAMEKKNNIRYSYYKCAFCDGYHVGGNR